MAMKKGDSVIFSPPSYMGKILSLTINSDTGLISYLVEYKNEAGIIHQRWYAETDLKAAP